MRQVARLGMSVLALKLVQFRSHAVSELALDGRPVAIFGPNGAGKTNILEAVSLLSPGRGLRRAASDAMGRRATGVGWKVTAALSGHEVETWAEAGAARQVRLDGKAARQLDLAQVTRVLWLVPAMDRLWIEGAEGRRRFLDRAVMSFRPTHAELTLLYEKAMRERNRLLKDQVRDPHWYVALERQMAESGALIDQGRREVLTRLAAAQEGAETAFPAAELSLVQADGTSLPADLAEAFAASRGRDLAAGRSLIGPHRSDLEAVYRAKGTPARECSTGEQKALLVSLILANARSLAQSDGRAPILLLDEVAAHLDSSRRAALYDEICALGAQAWMTGTGPELFAELGNRAAHFEVTEAEGTSQVTQRG